MPTMSRLPSAVIATALTLLALAGCSSQSDPAPSTGCTTAMEELAAAPADASNDVVDPLLEATLNECATGEEWVAALRERPEAMALSSAAGATLDLFEVACVGFPDTVACRSE